jgi:hypothetical protein
MEAFYNHNIEVDLAKHTSMLIMAGFARAQYAYCIFLSTRNTFRKEFGLHVRA